MSNTFTRESRASENAIASQKTAESDALNLAEAVANRSSGAIARSVNDTLVLDDGLIYECVNEAIKGMEPHQAELFKRALQTVGEFGPAIKRVTVDLGVVLVLAKTFESDDAFIDSAGLLHGIDFSAHGGRVADFSRRLIATDLKAAKAAKDGEGGEDAIMYEQIPYDVVKRRLTALSAFIDHATKPRDLKSPRS